MVFRWPYKWRKKEGCPLCIPHLAGAIYHWDCLVENLYIKHCKLPATGVNPSPNECERIIVSLTSFPERINVCYYAIKSLMIQTRRADRIILWLADSQFPEHRLPDSYKELLKRGLEIRYCADLKSHKKYYYALQEQKPNELIITFDDDIIFEVDAIEKLVTMHRKFPNCVICNRGHEIKTVNGVIQKYSSWRLCTPEGVGVPSLKIMPSTGAGCLYPYQVMPATTFELVAIQKYSFTADDIWMCFNRINAGVYAVKTKEKNAILCNVNNSQKIALTRINDCDGENQRTIDSLVELFPDVANRLINYENQQTVRSIRT